MLAIGRSPLCLTRVVASAGADNVPSMSNGPSAAVTWFFDVVLLIAAPVFCVLILGGLVVDRHVDVVRVLVLLALAAWLRDVMVRRRILQRLRHRARRWPYQP